MNNVNPNTDFSSLLASSIQDMQNSLGVLHGSLEHAFEVSENVQPEDLFATLQYETSRISSELFQLRVVQGLQRGHLVPQIDQHYLIEVFEELLDNNYVLFKSRNIEVELCCDHNLAWFFDRELVVGVLHSVLVNCSRYAKQKIALKAEQCEAKLVLQVLDDSRGYPDFLIESIPGVEDQDGRVSSQMSMTLAQEIARAHRQNEQAGAIALSNSDLGGMFELSLP